MFQAPKLTDAGKNLYYRNMAGEGIKFTTIQLGNGTISGPISAMTALVSAVVTIDAAVKNNAEQYADVSGHFSNAELEEGFYWREIGVFAADPDSPNDRSHDILYCYQNAYDTADFIPVASVETVEKNITVPIIVGDASTVSCTLSSSQVLVSEADLEAHDKDANAHNALFEKINKELEKKQDTITAKGILKGDQDAKGNPTVTKATPGVDYQQPTQVLTESNAMALTDTVPFFSGADGQNRKVTLKKLKEALGVQSASINVTTCAGAAVVCTDGETTLNGVGSTKFSLPENTGTWEVTATLNGHTASAVVEVTGAMQYNVDLVITSSVAVTHAPTKTTYNVGETFDPTGLVVTATYADGTTENVTDGCTFSPTVMAASTTAVTIKHQRAGVTVTTTQAVTVLEMSSISVKTAPNKTAYYIGESFDATGMVIEATMSNGTKKAVTGWTYTPSGALGLANTTITITYAEGGVSKTCTQAITVSNYLSSIAVTHAPTKTSYFTGETFSSAGMVVTATMADGSKKTVTGYTCSQARPRLPRQPHHHGSQHHGGHCQLFRGRRDQDDHHPGDGHQHFQHAGLQQLGNDPRRVRRRKGVQLLERGRRQGDHDQRQGGRHDDLQSGHFRVYPGFQPQRQPRGQQPDPFPDRQDQRHPGGPGRRQLRKLHKHHRRLYHEHVEHEQRRVE